MRLFEATIWVAVLVAWKLASPIDWGMVEANDAATCKKLADAMAKENGAKPEACRLLNVTTYVNMKAAGKLGVNWQHDAFPSHGFNPPR